MSVVVTAFADDAAHLKVGCIYSLDKDMDWTIVGLDTRNGLRGSLTGYIDASHLVAGIVHHWDEFTVIEGNSVSCPTL